MLQAMSQFLLINLDEFNSIPVNIQQGFLKNIVSLSSVKVKRPYGRRMEDFPRLASFIATANMTDLLADPSGSRRFLSVELTGPIDVSNVPYHEQLYAQAQALIDSGKRKLDGDTDVVPNPRRSRSRTAAKAVDRDDVRAGSRDTRGDGGDIMYCRDLDDDGLFVFRRFF